MQKSYIGVLTIILVVVLFALDNSKTIIVDFWIWQVESNLSLVLILSVLFGALSGFLFFLAISYKKNKEIKVRDKKIKTLEEKVQRLEHGLSEPVSSTSKTTGK